MFTFLMHPDQQLEPLHQQDYAFQIDMGEPGEPPKAMGYVPRMAMEVCRPAMFAFCERTLSNTGLLSFTFKPTAATLATYPQLAECELVVVPMMFQEPADAPATLH